MHSSLALALTLIWLLMLMGEASARGTEYTNKDIEVRELRARRLAPTTVLSFYLDCAKSLTPAQKSASPLSAMTEILGNNVLSSANLTGIT